MLLGVGGCYAQNLDVAIIVNKENTVDKLSAGEVKLYWLRKIKKRWPDLNKNIKPVDRKAGNPEQDAFYSTIVLIFTGFI